MKKHDDEKKYGKTVALIIFMICVFGLLIIAISVQTDGGKIFEELPAGIGYFLLVIMILIPVFLILLIIATFKKKESS